MDNIKIYSFIGEDTIKVNNKLFNDIEHIIKSLIIDDSCYFFLFTGKGSFNNICHIVLSNFKKKYNLNKIFRTYYYEKKQDNIISNCFKDELFECLYYLNNYDSWIPAKKNQIFEIVENSDKIFFYVDIIEKTYIYDAYKYAINLKKDFINLFKNKNNT